MHVTVSNFMENSIGLKRVKETLEFGESESLQAKSMSKKDHGSVKFLPMISKFDIDLYLTSKI